RTPRALPSFPTRRSSDLTHREVAEGLALADHHNGQDSRPDARLRRVPASDALGYHRARRSPDTAPPELDGEHGLDMVERRRGEVDRKSTRLNSSHVKISY